MKQIFSAFALLMALTLFGQEIKFQDANFQTLLANAKKDNKLIFVDAYASWCGPCKLMAKNVFTKPAVADFYNTNFINAKIDMEKGEGVALAKKYDVKAYPTYLFINGDGEVIYRGTGYYQENDFINIGKESMDPTKQLSVLKKRFESGEKNPEFLKSYIKAFAFSDPASAQSAAERLFAQKSPSEPLTPEELGYLFALTKDSNSPLFRIIESRKAELTKVIPEAQFDMMLNKYREASLMSVAYNKETKMLDEQKYLSEAKKIMPEAQAKKELLKVKMMLAKRDKDNAKLAKLATEYYGDGTHVSFTSEELNSIAWDIFETSSDPAVLKTAVKWAEQSVKKEESYYNTDTLANLLYKTGDRKNAKIWAQRSIELAKKSGEDYQSTQELLDKL